MCPLRTRFNRRSALSWVAYLNLRRRIPMNNEYTAPEVIEVGKAQEVILGSKPSEGSDADQPRFVTDNDLDD